jgi:hypothetical protein
MLNFFGNKFVVLARGATVAVAIAACGAGTARAQKVVDVSDLGNEVREPINSISAVLNIHSCLTDVERAKLWSYSYQLIRRLWSDFDRLGVKSLHYDPATGRPGSPALADSFNGPFPPGMDKEARDRAASRVLNYVQELERLQTEVEGFPICSPGTVSIQGPQFGWYIGGHFIKLTQGLKLDERVADTGEVTHQFSDSKDPLGVGVVVGTKFAPWANNVVVSPFLSFDYLNMSVNHAFPNGSFLGTKSNFAATAGVKVGPQLPMGVWLYGIAGASLLNETLNVNFIPVASSKATTVPGATVGVGAAFQPNFLQGSGSPVSLFLEYQHTWWQDAHFDMPAASPFFNYTFGREDDAVKLGFTVALGAPPQVPTYLVKARPK